ncbi:hypothetical protein [Paractinoplanes hotanensis]|uniref:Hydroxypyruvate isomerase n=1 Tax=Paractinoplanes hotanensis TaxID=2906497 RepID=A0ABT0XRC4_9ACTN|nr:hypothetical protein [Actinoplanes hotanensis]MCM4076287.1 hypothetical protein [Actinoplanes hotanensis]
MRLAVSAETVFLDLPVAERLRRIDELGYQGVVALESWASGSSEEALARFRSAFTED